MSFIRFQTQCRTGYPGTRVRMTYRLREMIIILLEKVFVTSLSIYGEYILHVVCHTQEPLKKRIFVRKVLLMIINCRKDLVVLDFTLLLKRKVSVTVSGF